MHLMIPYAAPLAEAARQAASALALPRMRALMARLVEVERDEGDEWSLSPPHERARAQAQGLRGGDGQLPWAAWLANDDGLAAGDQAWGLATPTHWHLGTDQVSLLDPSTLDLDESSSRALLVAVQELFTSRGFVVQYGAPLRWYLVHPSLADLATASLDRVIGRNVDVWLGKDPALHDIRRLQSEVQMLLHTHPLNAQREARGQLAVNSFWLSGCGVAQAATAAGPQQDLRLRGPALADDWAAWAKAWETLDEGPVAGLLAEAQAGKPLRLTLCGDRSWAAFEPGPSTLGRRLRSLWSKPSVAPLLGSL